ncbi:hypothetical protein PR202_ga00549 [Eleusine coracana subsp. coracana]|uniref:Proliferating cell nuclear antigen PCNA C-terminal domain-containing protein n=1 Tax=Eleusine coracana subsp. coracana TaxID=191504 RepID=A0AAV5BDC2_ELECO|nr:hypothetical protein PR202_ga00549 [Eleusine coracana subsp. coracana]
MDLKAMQAPVFSLTLDLKALYFIAKASALVDQVKICLSTLHPLMVECKTGNMSYMRCYLAPKIRTEIQKEEMSNEENEGSAEEKEGSIKEREKEEKDGRAKVGDPKRKQRSNRMKRRLKTTGASKKDVVGSCVKLSWKFV